MDSLKPEEIYKNVQILEDYNGKKVATSVKNKLVKDLSEAVEKDDIFNDLNIYSPALYASFHLSFLQKILVLFKIISRV